MRLSDTMIKAFNEQLTREFQASYLYTQMAAWLYAAGYPGAGSWMEAQAEEERGHGLRILRFIVDRGGEVRLGPLEAPPADLGSFLEVFERALEHERAVSAAIRELYALAMEESDYASIPLLDWFMKEQIEEEATVGQIVEDLRRAAGHPQALLLLDRELGARRSVESDG